MQELISGKLYRRPVEALLNRLTEYWQLSQPGYLRHLGLVRDTKQVNKTNVYVHFTRSAFSLLVSQGKASWEVVNGGKEENPILDAYGFPKLSNSIFGGSDNNASYVKCYQLAHIPEWKLPASDMHQVTLADGSLCKFPNSPQFCVPRY